MSSAARLVELAFGRVFRAEVLLARTFFARFFESDLMPPGLPQTRILIWSIAALAAPTYLLSCLSAIRYSELWHFARGRLPDAILSHQVFFVTFSMMALGFVALVIWEGVFPDRRDVRNLGVLPLSARQHVLGRVAALTAVAATFCIGVNGPTAVAYGLTLWLYDAATGPLQAVGGHLLATSAAGLFSFFALVATQGALVALFGRRPAQVLALLLQLAAVVAILQTFLFVPYLAFLLRESLHTNQPGLVSFLPPAWFLALYDNLVSINVRAPLMAAVAAVVATLVTAAAAIAILGGSYRRLVRLAIETPDMGRSLGSRVVGRALAVCAEVVARDPLQRAVAGFTLRTIARSRTHRMLLTVYVGIAAALTFSSLLPIVLRHGAAAFETPSVTVLSVPLIVNFFALCGMRAIFGLPAEIKANWTFRLHAADDRLAGIAGGARLAALAAVVVPVAVGTGIIGTVLWGAPTGAAQALFTALSGALLLDVLLIGFRKIPFACTYYPGRARLRTLWPFYAIAFSLYAYSLAGLELAALANGQLLATVLAIQLILLVVLAYFRRRSLTPPPGLIYTDEAPDAIFSGFGLSEGLAARTALPQHHNG